MPTPPKPASVLRMEGRSHRTKKELEGRERAEKALLTGKRMQAAADVKADAAAYSAWKRCASLLRKIGKDDALYEQQINRYCRLASEVDRAQRDIARLEKTAQMLDEWLSTGEIEPKDYLARMDANAEQRRDADGLLMRKRKMMMDIERENVMTIASSLRAIPKDGEKDEPEDAMTRMLREREARRAGG